MLKPFIHKIIDKQSLSQDEAMQALSLIMQGQVCEAQLAAFLVALRMKGESVAEIIGCVRAMCEQMVAIHPQTAAVQVDTCGTGGDALGTFNISTVGAVVAAGAGLCVAKHGNRAVSSRSGSAEVLKELGFPVDVTPEEAQQLLQRHGFAFLFAPTFHPAMEHVVGVRRDLAIRTIFNVLGPLCNPAGVKHQVIGVFAKEWLRRLADVLKNLGSEHVLLVHGHDGVDEFSLTGLSDVVELLPNGEIKEYSFDPSSLGLSLCTLNDLQGGGAKDNAEIARDVLNGAKGPRRDMVCLNAAAVIYVGGLANSLQEGLALAYRSIDSGKALKALNVKR